MDYSQGKNNNPFFSTANSGYGTTWQSSNGVAPLKIDDTPEYKDLVI